MLRKLSLSIRKIQGRKEIKENITRFAKWQEEIAQLKANNNNAKKLLIIRLDDIGDYLLFRNTLSAYRESPKWQGYEITLLGNVMWRSVYEFADNNAADKVIWVNKNEYFDNNEYREQLWQSLRNEGFDTVICPSRARPIIIDDACMLAAGATHNISGNNDLKYDEWNLLSDKLYTALYTAPKPIHEFLYNVAFANWCCGTHINISRPHINTPEVTTSMSKPYILCFVGGSKKSHRWPATHWIELIELCNKDGHYDFVISGGNGDTDLADTIAAKVQVNNITGKVTIPEVAGWMHQAAGVITNDTMSAHLAVSTNTPTLIVANGDNFYKFCDYKGAGFAKTDCVYPQHFLSEWKRHNYQPFKNYVAVTKDISTITAGRVYTALKQLLNR